MSIKSELENLCKQNGYRKIDASIIIASTGEKNDKDRLVAELSLVPSKGSKDKGFVEANDLIKNAFMSIEKAVASYSCKVDNSHFRGQVHEIFFLAEGWPKLKQKLDELGIEYKLSHKLNPKKITPDEDINDYLLPSSQKIFGFKPEK